MVDEKKDQEKRTEHEPVRNTSHSDTSEEHNAKEKKE